MLHESKIHDAEVIFMNMKEIEFVVRETDLSVLPASRRKVAEILIKLLQETLSGADLAKVNGPRDVYRLTSDMAFLDHEEFVVLFLNAKNRVFKRKTVSVGTLDASVVHPREVFKAAIQLSAAGIICVHNHPSGDPAPSEADLELTGRLAEAGRIVGIPLVDHVIVGRDGYYSLKEHGHF
jgi:DNA repair protein radc